MRRRRRGVGLLGMAAVGGVGYAAGRSHGNSGAAEQTRSEQTPPADSTMDEKIAQLQKLAELKSDGVLSETEYEAQKARILSP